ncbi:MAG: FecR domain-containing protein [Ignavibacteria bacterium]|jgi:ferric-dicitrate binding protein FerR (iron transport regulator)
MNKKNFINLVVRNLSKETTKEENKELMTLLKKQEYSEQYKLIKNKWETAEDDLDNLDFNVERGFNKLTSKIKISEPEYKTQTVNPFKNYWYDSSLLRFAASIAFFVIISAGILYYGDFFNGGSNEIKWNEKVTLIGQKSILTLFDGTKITLNADSKFKYRTNFVGDTRDVYLEGEAYFEVAHNVNKPFVVHTDKISTTVLGTKFNIKAFPEDREIAVSLVEGSIKVSTSNTDDELLEPSQQLLFNKTTGTGDIKEFDLIQTTGWKDNVLKFDNEPLNKVFAKLERTFGVKFLLEDTTYAQKKIKAAFNNESFWTVVKVIKSATGLEYRTAGNNNEIKSIIFHKNIK